MKNNNEIINMKKNILLLLMSLLFFMAADAQAQEWCDERSAAVLMRRISMLRFWAVLISCKTLQSTETNPHIRQGILLPVRWVIVGVMACVWKLNMLLEEML